MNKYTQCLVAFLLAYACSAGHLQGQCMLSEGTYCGFKSMILENPYIQVIVLPAYNGLIAEYNYKPKARKMFLPLELATFAVSDRLLFSETNFGGFKDWFWENGLVSVALAYECVVIKNTPKAITIRLDCDRADLHLQRSISIAADSTILGIEVKLAGTSREPVTHSYWAHNVLPKLEAGDLSQIPLDKAVTEKRKGVKIFNFDHISAPGIYDLRTISKNQQGEYHFVPAQGWWGVLKSDGTCFIQEVPDIKPLQTGDGFFYHSYHDKVLSQEIVFQAEQFQTGTERSFRINYLAATGFKGLDYASSHLLLKIDNVEKKKDALALTLTMASPKQINNGTLSLRLTDGTHSTTTLVVLAGMTPGISCSRQAVATNSAFALPGTEIRMAFALDANGKSLETGVINRMYVIP